MANPLDPIMDWYFITLDSLRVTQRVVAQAIPKAVTVRHKTLFRKPPAEVEPQLNQAKEELNRLVVLALTAIFERTLRDYLTQIPVAAIPAGDPHRDAVRRAIIEGIEYWNISETVLSVFPAVDANLRGLVKQVVDYRNWVAHGHTLAKAPPSNVVPIKAHQQLTDFLVQAGVIVR